MFGHCGIAVPESGGCAPHPSINMFHQKRTANIPLAPSQGSTCPSSSSSSSSPLAASQGWAAQWSQADSRVVASGAVPLAASQGFRWALKFATGFFDLVASLQQVASTWLRICNRSVRRGRKFAPGFPTGSQICDRFLRRGCKFATGFFDLVANLQQVASRWSQICNRSVGRGRKFASSSSSSFMTTPCGIAGVRRVE